ncbi:MAG TPA: hypothetical protein VM389_11745, partial [Phycisphaerae bacterium]|nr:hypothetical protein [Phycisphaerae bacterium]
MTVLRFMAIVAIFAAVSVGWLVLAGVTSERTDRMDESLSAEMADLWGPPVLAQPAPRWVPEGWKDGDNTGVIVPSSSRITAAFTYE